MSLFKQHMRTIQGGKVRKIDLKLYPDGSGELFHDDLTFPVIRLRSRIPRSERMRRFGVLGLRHEDSTGEVHPQGGPIPTEDYIRKSIAIYGDNYETKVYTLDEYRHLPLEEAIASADRDLQRLVTAGEYEIVG